MLEPAGNECTRNIEEMGRKAINEMEKHRAGGEAGKTSDYL